MLSQRQAYTETEKEFCTSRLNFHFEAYTRLKLLFCFHVDIEII